MSNCAWLRTGCFLCSLFPLTTLQANNGDQMVGVNAVQWALGGAVVASPREAGTLFANPAGLAALDMQEARLDMGFGLINPDRSANGVESDSDFYLIPAGAAAFRIGDDLVLGVGMAGLAGTGVDVADAFPALAGNQAVVTTKQVFKLGPGLGYRVSDRLTLGAALHLDYQSLALYNPSYQLPQTGTFGYGFGLGALYLHDDHWSFGVSYTSEQKMDELEWNTLAGRYRMDIDAPAHLTLGVAYRPADDWQIEFDVKRIWFSDVFGSVPLHTPGGTVAIPFGWEDQTVYMLGVEKVLTPHTRLLLGYNHGKSPIGPEDVDANLGSVAISEQHLAIGLQRSLTDTLTSTLTYTRVLENTLTSNSGSGNRIVMDQHVLHFQISYAH